MKASKKILSVVLALVLTLSVLSIVPFSANAAAQLAKPNVTLSNKSNGVRSEWGAVSGAVKYRVFYKSETDRSWTSKDTANTYYPLLGTVSGRKYAFQVQAIGKNNAMGPYSTVKNIVYYPPATNTKPVVTLSCKSNGIRAEWQKISGATAYTVYYRPSTVKTWSSATTKNNYYPYLGAVRGKTYCFQVLPMFGNSKGAYSKVASILFPVIPKTKPVVTLSNKTNGIRAEWNAVNGATAYRVFYRDNTTDQWNHTDVKNTYFAYLAAECSNMYCFQVQPLFNGAEGSYSAVKTIVFDPVVTNSIGKPEITNTTPGYNNIDFFWKPVNGASGYIVVEEHTGESTGWGTRRETEDESTCCYYAEEGETATLRVRAYTDSGSRRYGPWLEVEIRTYDAYDHPDVIDQDGFVDASFIGDNKGAKLKVWVPDSAYDLTVSQIRAFKKHYPNNYFSNISVVVCGENEAAINMVDYPDESADVFMFPSDQIQRLRSAHCLLPVSNALRDTVKQENSDLSVSIAEEDNGFMAGYPASEGNGCVLVYDKSVVSDTQVKTLEGVLAACKQSNKKFVMDGGNGFYSCMFAFTGGVIIDGFEDDDETQRFKDYDEEEAIATLMRFASLMKTYKGTFVHDNVAEISTGFYNKTVGAGIDGPWDFDADRRALGNNFGAAKLPTVTVNGTQKQMVGWMGTTMVGINSYSDYPKAAQMLAYYLSSEPCQKQRAEELSWVPSNRNAQEAAKSDPAIAAMIEQGECSVPQVNISLTLWTCFGTMGAEMYKNSWNPDSKSATRRLLNITIANIRDE